ncbi:MAG: diaminopimelate epimerase [Microscillaceae bacterium]
MQSIPFFKYQGTGNDFVMLDGRGQKTTPLTAAQIAQICHRRFGVGADGLIRIEEAEGYDFRMVYFNADGYEGSMCGNGGRCAVRFAHDLGLIGKNTHFIAVDGPHAAFLEGEWIHLKMKEVNRQLEQINEDFFLDTGSPHYVRFVPALSQYEVLAQGQAIRYSPRFAASGTNVNFVSLVEGQTLAVRTYERGVEDETYSCGTGVTAAALVAHQQHGLASPVSIQTKGGLLRVSFEVHPAQFSEIYLAGPAQKVFAGTYALRDDVGGQFSFSNEYFKHS